MIYEYRLKRLGKQHVYAGLLTILMLFLMSRFDIGSTRYWWSYSIGIVLAIGVLYLVANSRVRVETTDRIVTVYHSGMIHANIQKVSIAEAVVSSDKSTTRIAIFTNDGLEYDIPCECFSATEINALLNELRKA